MIEDARLILRQASKKITEEDIAAKDRKRRARNLETKVVSKLGSTVAYQGLQLEVIFVKDHPVAQLSALGITFYLRTHNGMWRLSRVDAGVETDIADVQDGDPRIKQWILVAIGDHV
jgi:hypothetical protein